MKYFVFIRFESCRVTGCIGYTVVFLTAVVMEQIVRHFIARRLGRGLVTAIFAPDGGVVITVELDPSVIEQGRIVFTASSGCAKSVALSGVELLYRLSRHAISQIQRRVRDTTCNRSPLELDCSFPPWQGDLALAPYGGATTGCAELSTSCVSTKIRRIALVHLGYLRR